MSGNSAGHENRGDDPPMMDLMEAGQAAITLLEEKLHLTLDRDLFWGGLPPGVKTGVFLSWTGIRTWEPDRARECYAELHGIFGTESELSEALESLPDLLQCRGESGILSWQMPEAARIQLLPGEPFGRCELVMPLLVAFV